MGYYTYYQLDILTSSKILEEEIAAWMKENLLELYESTYEDGHSDVKWYYEDCMSEFENLIKKWPNVQFKMWGDGEDDDDKWVAFAWNGEYYVDVWKPPSFDRTMLPQYKDYCERQREVELMKNYFHFHLPFLVLNKIQNYILGDLKDFNKIEFI